MTCPFSYLDEYDVVFIAADDLMPNIQEMRTKKDKPVVMCDLRNNKECVGEDICPIMKK